MTPRQELTVLAWESRRMRAALLVGDADPAEDPPGVLRPVLLGLILAAIVVLGVLVI